LEIKVVESEKLKVESENPDCGFVLIFFQIKKDGK